MLEASAALPSCMHALHPQLQCGRFELWPSLKHAVQALRRVRAAAAEVHESNADARAEAARTVEAHMSACEHGALLFLRHVLMTEHVGLPCGEWPHHTGRTCERFGEAYASFAHTDLRLPSLRLFNIWVCCQSALGFSAKVPSAAFRRPLV